MYIVEIENNTVIGFYTQDINGGKECSLILERDGINIDEELHRYLLSLGKCKFTGIKEDRVYSMKDKDLFEEIIQQSENKPIPKTEVELIKEKQEMQDKAILELSTLMGGSIGV